MIINSYKDLRVFQNALGACMDIFEQTKTFPGPERFALVDQVRRSSRSVCANLAEAWRRRRYEAAFVAKLCDSESEASETQVWIEIARRCGYFQEEVAKRLDTAYDQTTAQIVRMTQEPQKWRIREQKQTEVSRGPDARALKNSRTPDHSSEGTRKH